MTFTEYEKAIFWVCALIGSFSEYGDEKLTKVIETYRLTNFPTISEKQVQEIYQEQLRLFLEDAERLETLLRGGN